MDNYIDDPINGVTWHKPSSRPVIDNKGKWIVDDYENR